MSLVALHTSIGNDLTRKTAIEHGFRKNARIYPNASPYDLIKISYNGYVVNSSWETFRHNLLKVVDLKLPDRMPTYDEFVYTGAVLKSKSINGIVKLPLFEMETLFSPATFLCSGRQAIIIPIRQPYIERLLAETKRQMSLFPSNEALLYVEKAYFKSSRNMKLFNRGDLLLFYASGKEGGKQIIGHGRLTSSRLMNVIEVMLKLERQGAFGEQELNNIADKDGNVHAITFDNFTFFSKPISYDYLRQKRIISRANLVTAEKISAKALNNIISEGELRE